MNQTDQLTILLEIKSKMDELEKVRTRLDDLEKRSRSFKDMALAGLGLKAGAAIWDKAASSLTAVAHALQEAVKEGLAYNAAMETAAIRIATVLHVNNPERWADVNKAMATSVWLTEELHKRFRGLDGGVASILPTWQRFSAFASQAGMSLVQQLETFTSLARVGQAMGMDIDSLARQFQAAATGNFSEKTWLMGALGVDSDAAKRARDEGRLFDFYQTKLAGVADMAELAAGSHARLQRQIRGTKEELKGLLTEPMFQQQKAQKALELDLLSLPIVQAVTRMAGIGLGLVSQKYTDLLAAPAGALRFLEQYGPALGATGANLSLTALLARAGSVPGREHEAPPEAYETDAPRYRRLGPVSTEMDRDRALESWKKANDRIAEMMHGLDGLLRAPTGLATRGLWASLTSAVAFSNRDNVQRAMLDELRRLRSLFESGGARIDW